jgi:hypothetical protein
MSRESNERLSEGFSNWLTFSDHPFARDWRRFQGPAGGSGGLWFWLILVVLAYFLFISPYSGYAVLRDALIRRVYPDKVQVVENNEVVAEFTTYAPILTAETFLVGKYQKGTLYSKAVLPQQTWRTYYFGKPTNNARERVVFSRGDSYATVLVDYGDGVVHDLNLGRTTQESPFHLSLFSKGQDFGWIEAGDLPDRPYFR